MQRNCISGDASRIAEQLRESSGNILLLNYFMLKCYFIYGSELNMTLTLLYVRVMLQLIDYVVQSSETKQVECTV